MHLALDDGAAVWLHEGSYSKPWPSPLRLYLHALCVEDITIQSVLGEGAPLFTSLWHNESGPPSLPALREYAEAVYTSTDAYLDGLSTNALTRIVDLARLGMGWHAVGWVIRRFVVQECGHICAEIAKDNLAEETERNSAVAVVGPASAGTGSLQGRRALRPPLALLA
jgi:hypothetical protein